MTKFEYRTVILKGTDMTDSNHDLSERVNEYGKDGWELVSIVSQTGLGSSPYNLVGISQKNILIFKRPFA